MSRKLYLFSGHSATDSGAIAFDGRREADLAQDLALQVATMIVTTSTEIDTVYRDDPSWSLAESIAELNRCASPGDLCVELHFNHNHPTASGTEAFVHRNTSPENAAFASQLTATVADVLRIPNRGVKTEEQSARGRIGILHARPRVVLLEVCFLNKGDLDRYDEYRPTLVHALSKAIQDELTR